MQKCLLKQNSDPCTNGLTCREFNYTGCRISSSKVQIYLSDFYCHAMISINVVKQAYFIPTPNRVFSTISNMKDQNSNTFSKAVFSNKENFINTVSQCPNLSDNVP